MIGSVTSTYIAYGGAVVVFLHVNCWDSVIRVSPTLYLSVYYHYKVAVPISKSMNLGPSRVTL